MQCIVVTPEATVLEQDADFVALPLYDGEIGIAPGHAPMIGRLGYGEMRVRHGNQTIRYYVDSGFVQVADDVVSVLTNRAVSAAQLNVQAASEQLAVARDKVASSEEALAIRERQIAQARAQLRVAERAR
jgi:F-type H+-transporting ATPase subunit epsilon